MRIHLIVAVSQNGVIGRAGQIPWRISEDLKRFKAITLGHPMIMGRKTWDSIGKPLPGRESIVVTRQAGWAATGATRAASLQDALSYAEKRGATDVFVIGGGEIYREALPLADVLHVTEVHARADGDVTFPAIEKARWRETAREERRQTDVEALRFAFVTYERA